LRDEAGGAASTPPDAGSAAAFADGLISIEQLLFAVDKTWRQRMLPKFKRARDGFHFLWAELASAPAGEYSVVLIHDFTPCWFFEHRPETGGFTQESEIHRTSQARRRRALTADFSDAVISVRAGRVGADGKRNKPSIDEIGFRRGQFTRAPAG